MSGSATRTPSDWLSLEQAAARLNVHPTTLREWADRGRIRTFRTPGGHRRFSADDVASLGRAAQPDLTLFTNATVGHARLAASGGKFAAEAWYARFDEAAKERQRLLGTDLVRALAAYVGGEDRQWSHEIRQIGQRYAELARDAGLSLGDTMRAFHMFEGLVRSSVDQLTAAHAAAAGDLEQNAGWFLNEVRVAMVESMSGSTK